MVKEILRRCVTCKRYPDLSPDLPDYSVDHLTLSFQATGLDFAGPPFVRDAFKNNKAYILLLACASSRAIHLELVPDMSASGFLRGFKRFTTRRGVPDIIVDDNFKTFRSAEVKRFMTLHGVKQHFILPGGGGGLRTFN